MISMILNTRGSVQDIKRQLDEVYQCDSIIEKKIKQAKTYITIAGVLTALPFILIFLGVAAGAALFFLALLFLLLPALMYRLHLTKQDIENRRYDMARDFFETVGRDIPSKVPSTLSISFESYQKHGKLDNKSSEGFLGAIRTFSYTDKWFSLGSKLHDGNVFKIEVEQAIKRKEKSKRKYTKVAEVINEKVKLVMRIDPATYPGAEKIAASMKPGMNVAGMSIERVAFGRSILRIIATTPGYRCIKGRYGTQEDGKTNLLDGKKLVSLFLYIYKNLQDCR